ncbi:hypothetical protein LOTGIDRAFT_229427 [Lottia gigantea]|uniref:Uncharacterized protein n=1 Tax=Lottia gigantea TaxID=225164 RepID=V3Z439_LOTGI|nr:hypothetical protein LOTGIDRAFT_229427 [Lottia gigantea]ESO85408.1 hypothetical protein LOTGIDRAFT_229427 [Lottia gigantea]
MTLFKYLCVLIFSIIATEIVAETVVLEAETHDTVQVNSRTKASGNQTVWLHQGDLVSYTFCLLRSTIVTVQNVRTSNDGQSDTLKVSVDGGIMPNNVVSFGKSDFGRMWNEFSSSGEIGAVTLEAGQHSITLEVISADSFGVELDVIEFNVDDDELTNNTFTCNLQCSFTPPTVTATPNLLNGKAIQKSTETLCSAETNVKIPVYNAEVQTYEISTNVPQFTNPQNLVVDEPDVCPDSPSVYMNIENVSTGSNVDVVTLSETAQYFINNMERGGLYIVVATFFLNGRKSGSIDADIGAEVTYELESLQAPASVRMIYSHKDGNSVTSAPVEFNGSKTKHSWTIPDFTWNEEGANALIMHVTSANRNHVIKSLKIERRNTVPDQVVEVHSSDVAKIEVIKKDFWWLSGDRMEVVYPGQDPITDAASIRIQFQISPTSAISEVFSLSQDGLAKLFNPSSDSIGNDFKTSVIIGQNNPDDYRPSAPIQRVEMVPGQLKMIITYQDSGKATISLSPTVQETKATISELDLKQNQGTTPFATLRSMYIETGYSDSDSITSDLSATERVLGGSWTEVAGTTFLLHRRCDSKTSTKSPDLKLTVTSTLPRAL